MFLIIILGTFISILVGIISGLIPGLHINNLIYVFANISNNTISLEIKAIVFIISSIIFSFLSIIPATIFSIPNTENFVSVMPCQKLFSEGKGYYAIYLYVIGAINAIIFGLPLFILFTIFAKYLPTVIDFLTPIILIIGLIILMFNSKNYFGYFIILFSALIGYFALSYSSIENPLIVLISGLFGLSTIIFAMQNKLIIPKQQLTTKNIDLKTKIKVGIIAPTLSIFVSLFPGLGNGFATYLGNKVLQLKDEYYILLNGAINVSVMIFSFLMILYLEKARTASAVFLEQFAKDTFVFSLSWIIIFSLIGIILGYFSILLLAKIFIKNAHKINYKILHIIIIVFLHIIVLLFSNLLGLIVFWLSSLIGYLCIRSENPRILMLSCIIFPVLLYFI